jgi:hypothetical protein
MMQKFCYASVPASQQAAAATQQFPVATPDLVFLVLPEFAMVFVSGRWWLA